MFGGDDPRAFALKYAGDLGGDFTGNEGKARFSFTLSDRYLSLQRAAPIRGVQEVECDVHYWVAPNQMRIAAALVMRCPQCEFPLAASLPQGPAPQGHEIDGEGRLTLPGVVACPGHWGATNPQGQAIGGHVRCGLQMVIRQGKAHNPRCPAADYLRIAVPRAHDCLCGAILSEAEDQQLRRRG